MFIFLKLEDSGYTKSTSVEDATRENFSKLKKVQYVFPAKAY